jgi:hypothetical protein
MPQWEVKNTVHEIGGLRQTSRVYGPSRAPLAPIAKAKTAKTRELGACPFCKASKIRVSLTPLVAAQIRLTDIDSATELSLQKATRHV